MEETMNFSTNGAGLDIHSLKKKKKKRHLATLLTEKFTWVGSKTWMPELKL